MSANGSPDHALNTLERCAAMSRDELAEYAASLARRLDSISGVQREELAERKYKEGFDAGVAYQKKADPPPKARDLGKQLMEEREAWSTERRKLEAKLAELRLGIERIDGGLADSMTDPFVWGETTARTALDELLEGNGDRARPRLRVFDAGKPLDVLGNAKRVASKAAWSLALWEEFSDRARKTLDNDASPESLEKFHAVVREYFEVTT